jgi:hypothetical protein
MPSASTMPNLLAPVTIITASASRMPGKASKASFTDMMTRSVQPRR